MEGILHQLIDGKRPIIYRVSTTLFRVQDFTTIHSLFVCNASEKNQDIDWPNYAYMGTPPESDFEAMGLIMAGGTHPVMAGEWMVIPPMVLISFDSSPFFDT